MKLVNPNDVKKDALGLPTMQQRGIYVDHCLQKYYIYTGTRGEATWGHHCTLRWDRRGIQMMYQVHAPKTDKIIQDIF
jgi:hypothetical protein